MQGFYDAKVTIYQYDTSYYNWDDYNSSSNEAKSLNAVMSLKNINFRMILNILKTTLINLGSMISARYTLNIFLILRLRCGLELWKKNSEQLCIYFFHI